jgi:hypothetical protein
VCHDHLFATVPPFLRQKWRPPASCSERSVAAIGGTSINEPSATPDVARWMPFSVWCVRDLKGMMTLPTDELCGTKIPGSVSN